jgi:hypothetical protein
MSKIYYPKELFPSIVAWIKTHYIRNTAEDKGLNWYTTSQDENGMYSWKNENTQYLTLHCCYIPFFAYLIEQKWETEEAAIAGSTNPSFSGTEVRQQDGNCYYGNVIRTKCFRKGLTTYQLSYVDPWKDTNYVEFRQAYMQNFKYYDVEGTAQIVPLSYILGNDYALNRENLVKWFKTLNTITTTAILQLGSKVLALLTDEDKKIATNKGWTLV